MASQPAIIDAHDVDLAFGTKEAVQDLTFSVDPGTIFGLIGPSGSGKTSTVRLLTGLYRPQRGALRVLGADPIHFRARTREKIGYMPQLFTLYPNLTVWENMNFVASLYCMSYFGRRRRLNELLEFVELADARDRLGGKLSGGMQRRLSLACSLVHDPILLFADEPTAGIDPVLRNKFWEYFRNLRSEGHTLFITTQYVGEAAYCDYVGVMREGRLLHLDTPEGLRHTALGGEVIKLVVQAGKAIDAQQILARHPIVNDVRRSHGTPGLVYVYVDEASEALPVIFKLFNDHPEIQIQTAEEYLPPFDDIFIALMEQAEQRRD